MTPEKIGRYEIKSELGRGGMAIVYLARDPRTDRDVAIKVLPREFLFDPQFHVRFEREIKTVAQLEHPAIVPIHDVGEEDGQPYFVMRYMPDGSLADWLKRDKVSLQDTARIVERLAKGLHYAHSKGIVHRDLKPGNILFDSNDDAFVSDFGVAKLADAAVSMTGSGVIGTPAYMSPEQAQSASVDARADIYALGSIIFEMLTGRQPYKADTPMSVILKHITEPAPDISVDHPEFPEELSAVIKKAMHKDPAQRYGSMIELARDLNKVAFGEEGHLTEMPVTRPAMPSPAAVLANSKTPTLAPDSAPIAAAPSSRSNTKWIAAGLGALALILILGCAFVFMRWNAAKATPTATAEATQAPVIITATSPPVTDTHPTMMTEQPTQMAVAITPSSWFGRFRWFGSLNPVTFVIEKVNGDKFKGAMYWTFTECKVNERVDGDIYMDISAAPEQNRWAQHPDFVSGDKSGAWLRWTQNEAFGGTKCTLSISGDWWYAHINSQGHMTGIHFTNSTNSLPDAGATFDFTEQ